MDDPDGGITSFLVNTDTGIIRFGSHDFDHLIGEAAAAHGLDLAALTDGDGIRELTIDGEEFLGYAAGYSSAELGNYVLAYRYYGTLGSSIGYVLVALGLILVLLTVVTVSGVIMEQKDPAPVARKMIGMVIFGEVLVGLAVFCFSTVADISLFMRYSNRLADAFLEGTQKNAEAGAEVNQIYEQRSVSIARSTNGYLELLEGDLFGDRSAEPLQYLSVDEEGRSVTIPDVFGHPTVSVPFGCWPWPIIPYCSETGCPRCCPIPFSRFCCSLSLLQS